MELVITSEADNTVRESKNQYVLTYLHLLVAKGFFKATSLACLRKSHTHCRVGSFAGSKHLFHLPPISLGKTSLSDFSKLCVTEISCGGLSLAELVMNPIFKILLM